VKQSSHEILTPDAASTGVPKLPDGWRPAEREDDWGTSYEVGGRRQFVLLVSASVILVAAVVGVLVWVAAGHYARGVEALRDGAYARAIGELSAARVLFIPYRDADGLEQQARHGLQDDAAAAAARRELVDRVAVQLERVDHRLASGTATEVLQAIQDISPVDLRAARAGDDAVRAAAVALADALEAAARAAMSRNEWARAGRYAAALLVLQPSSEEGAALAKRAKTGQELSEKLAAARRAADGGHWREALRLALAVTAVRKDFPGAADLIADARKALAPKPKRTVRPATAPEPEPVHTGGGTHTPTLPPPP